MRGWSRLLRLRARLRGAASALLDQQPSAQAGGRYQGRIEAFARAVFDSPGTLDPATRRAAGRAEHPQPEIAAYLAKVAGCAHAITDDDVATLRRVGLTEDQIFELTAGASFGACLRRYEAGMSALRARK